MKNSLSFPAVFFGVFIHPRETTKLIIENKYYSFRMPFVVFNSFLTSLNPIFAFPLVAYLPFAEAFTVTVFLLFGLGVLCFFPISRLIWWLGTKFEGKGTLEEVRTACALNYTPMIVAAFLKIILDLPALITLLTTTTNLNNFTENDFLKSENPISGFIVTVFAIWSIVISIICLSEAHQFSVGKSIKTNLALMAIFIGTALLFAGSVMLFVRLGQN